MTADRRVLSLLLRVVIINYLLKEAVSYEQ